MLQDRIERNFGFKLDAFKNPRRAAVGYGIMILGAKLSGLDGKVTRTETETATELFHVPCEELPACRNVFDEACQNPFDYEAYAVDLGRFLADRKPVLEKIMAALFHIAEADGEINAVEYEFLEKVNKAFGLKDVHFRRGFESHTNGGHNSLEASYRILGLPKEASDREVHEKYHTLALKYHPDHLLSLGLPPELVGLAEEKMAAINVAYQTVRKQRAQARA